MRSRARIAALAMATLGVAAVGVFVVHAEAQPRKPAATKPKVKPMADAGEPAVSSEDGGAAPAPPSPVPAVTSAAGPGDAGERGDPRASPLNPAPAEMPGALDAGAASVDYDRLLGDIAALRARVAAVGDTLFHARLAVAVATDGDNGQIGRLAVAIDDGVVYTAPAGFHAEDLTPVYAHAVAPGRHAVTIDVDRKDTRNDAFRTAQRSRFTVEVPRDMELGVEVKILDDSSMGGDFPSDQSGKYDLRVRVKATARKIKR